MPRTRLRVATAVAGWLVLVSSVQAGTDEEAVRRSTAVTLNYCRASFHRIQRAPTSRVLMEEQEKILNNLDLNGIADQDVVKLYTAVLVEISELRLVDRERQVIGDKFRASLGTALTAEAFDFGCQLASAQYLSAIRTGARSWWDYRNISTAREVDVFHVDRQRLMAFTDKSGQFLSTFWKLARERKIPDKWLVRNQDLLRLDVAMQERDFAVRLRVLKRMEEFMSCYPPYWYYVARTQQALGDLEQAADTYNKLLEVGRGHFRKDDMLAAGMANRAIILDYLKRPEAIDTAGKALGFSTDVWEANLMCAQVLGRAGRTPEAEDAILRNLDVDLERDQSLLALVSLYTVAGRTDKLRQRLSNPAVVRRIPVPALLRSTAVLGPRHLPDALAAHLAASLGAHYDLNFGADDFVLVTVPAWQLQSSEMSLAVGEESHRQSTISLFPGRSDVRFARIGEIGHPLQGPARPPGAILTVKFPETPIVRLKLEPRPDLAASGPQSAFPVVERLASASLASRRLNLFLVGFEIGQTEFDISRRPAAAPGYDAATSSPVRPQTGDESLPASPAPATAPAAAAPSPPPSASGAPTNLSAPTKTPAEPAPPAADGPQLIAP
jgi:tetratricopeptide (TPR) repeat protein